MIFRSSLRLLASLAMAACLISTPSQAEEGQRVILVLDASGSMWGQIDGKPKMQIAKEVVGKVIGNWKPEDEIGLVAYGHRKKGACDDIEVLSEPGKLDAASFMDKVKALNPKGKTPMTEAIRRAAESLKYTERQATVILVSDGIETCDPNPCAVAAELEKLGVGLTVHTVGFGLDDKGAVAQLKCLAETTGGISILAENADELEDALTKTVEAKTEPEPAPPAPEPVAEFNLTGTAEMAEGVGFPQKFANPNWEFYISNNGEKGEWVKTEYGPAIKTSIENPGSYIGRVSLSAAAVEVPFTIEAGKPVVLDVSMEAGVLQLTGMMDATTPVPEGAQWQLLNPEGGMIGAEYGQTQSFLANAGSYKVMLTVGEAKIVQDVTVTAGKIDDITMTLGAGVVEATAVFAAGGPAVPQGATFELQKAETNIDGKHDYVATSYAAPARFEVPSGKYILVVSRDYATGSAEIEVKACTVSKAEINLDGGFLAVTAAADTTLEIYSAEKDISGNRKYIATEFNGQFNKAFEAGAYHVTVSNAGGIVAEKDFEVKAGQRTEGTIP